MSGKTNDDMGSDILMPVPDSESVGLYCVECLIATPEFYSTPEGRGRCGPCALREVHGNAAKISVEVFDDDGEE